MCRLVHKVSISCMMVVFSGAPSCVFLIVYFEIVLLWNYMPEDCWDWDMLVVVTGKTVALVD